MELYVRSQDKMKLVKVNYCYIMDQQDHFTIIGETIDSGPIIGTYKSKERALQILDEIQEYLEKQGQVYLLTNENGIITSQKHYGFVYQMPSE